MRIGHMYFFYMKLLFTYFAHFSIGLFVFSLLIYKCSLYRWSWHNLILVCMYTLGKKKKPKDKQERAEKGKFGVRKLETSKLEHWRQSKTRVCQGEWQDSGLETRLVMGSHLSSSPSDLLPCPQVCPGPSTARNNDWGIYVGVNEWSPKSIGNVVIEMAF